MAKLLQANATTSAKGFYKSNPWVPAFSKTSDYQVITRSRICVEVDGAAIDIAQGTPITMSETAVAGTDYAIWVEKTGNILANSNFSTPPSIGARKIGGFHYAPGGNASGTTGGNTTPSINEYSFWDLKWRPQCRDPRGMTLVSGAFWCDIYLTGVDAITNGSSKFNVVIADGSSPPKVPLLFGGDGTATYGSYTWFEAQELAISFGKRSLNQQEFMAAAYGVTQASSRGSDPVNTIVDAPRTSKWGLMQATGNLYLWGIDRGGPTSNTITDGRGTETSAPNSAIFGGGWGDPSNSGSRCAYWSAAASLSGLNIGSRFACDHLQLV